MVRGILITSGFLFCTVLCARAEDAQQLPSSSSSDESFEVEPPLLIPYRAPGNKIAETEPSPPPATVEQLTRDLERAKRSAINAERLYRMGVFAKVEAERKALRVVRIQAELEKARLNGLKEQATQADEQKVVTAKAEQAEADKAKDAELAKAIEAAHAAARKRDEAELAQAETDLERERKLLSLGSGHKSAVAKAERKVAELKAGRN